MVDEAGHRDRVRIAGVVVSRGLRDGDPAHWQRLLRRSLVSGERPLCLCRGGGTVSLPMVIATHSRTLVMKRMPNTGMDHHPDCESHGGHESRVAGVGKTLGALRPLPGGLLDAKLVVSLHTLTGAGRCAPPLGEETGSAVQGRGVTQRHGPSGLPCAGVGGGWIDVAALWWGRSPSG